MSRIKRSKEYEEYIYNKYYDSPEMLAYIRSLEEAEREYYLTKNNK